MTPKPPLTLDATLAAIERIGEYLDAVSADAGMSEPDAYRLRLAVDELATNVIIHAYNEHGLTGPISVRAETIAEGVRVTIEDNGPAFDPRARALPADQDLSVPLEDREIGGLGLLFVIKSVDELRYERRGDTNVTTVDVRRRPDEAPRSA